MKNAVFPGSFDPFTVGHLDILKRACEIFDHVTVCVIPNPAKHYLFGDEDKPRDRGGRDKECGGGQLQRAYR